MKMTNWSRKSLFHAEGDNETLLASSKIQNLNAGLILDREDGFRYWDPIAVIYQ
jgi:hypothetical protein